MDPAAIEHSIRNLPQIAQRLEAIPGDVFTAARKFRAIAPLNLILAGGLFDYLNERQITWLLPKLFALLKSGGSICFTNLAPGNPDRVWLQHIANWHITERSESDILRMVGDSGLAAKTSINVARDTTGLTQLVELSRTEKGPEI
jgi:O-methyltransferase involved in polyketide biosynthesis